MWLIAYAFFGKGLPRHLKLSTGGHNVSALILKPAAFSFFTTILLYLDGL